MCQNKKIKIYPPTQLLILLVIQIAANFIFPIRELIFLPINYFGIILIIFGAIINLRADNIFKKHNTTVKPDEKPTKLIDTGPFRISRHPMYLGMTLILSGTAIFLGSLISFIFPIIFFLIIHYNYIPEEEKRMQDEFGQSYIDYKNKVRKWI